MTLCRLEPKSLRICSLPRESRLVFTLYGRKLDANANSNAQGKRKRVRRELGWGAMQIFDYEKYGKPLIAHLLDYH